MSKFTNSILSLLLLAILCFSQKGYGQTEGHLENEILVFILPDSLEIHPPFKSRVDMGQATVKSDNLSKALNELNASGIAKAFPDWEDAPKIVMSEDGEEVKAPDFHRVFILYFSKKQ